MLKIVPGDFILNFVYLELILSDIDFSLKSITLQARMETFVSLLITEVTYAPISNEEVEWMVGTIQHEVTKAKPGSSRY